MIQRGTCFFSDKVVNAQAAGAEAVIIFNQGNTPAREGLIVGTLAPITATIPVVGASFADGAALAQAGSTARVNVEPPEQQTQFNVLAELPGRRNDNTIMVGAHLDWCKLVPELKTTAPAARQSSRCAADGQSEAAQHRALRLVGWEESGLIGSTAYVGGLTDAEQQAIALYLNFDMVGSPNYGFFVYDGDNSDATGSGPGPEGSAQIEKLFEAFYLTRSQPFAGTDFDGRSDYGPFIAVGIPSGGLFTGAEGIKTPDEVALWGGTAGIQFDPCYHLACDTFANINDFAYATNTDSVEYSHSNTR